MQPLVAAHWPRQSWKVGAKFWPKSLPLMMNPHMVVKSVPSARWEPPSVTQFELALGKEAMAESLVLRRRWRCRRMFAINMHCPPEKVAPSHFG